MNPPARGPGWRALLPDGVVVCEHRGPVEAGPLYPQEAQAVARAAPKRLRDFAAGRWCARTAMEHFGVTGFPVLMDDDKCPVWPGELTGSITHTADYCAAAVGRRTQFLGIGIDAEVAGAVAPDLWPRICTAAEIDFLHRAAQSERALWATVLFSAKEAYYKYQYPLTRRWAGFHEVGVEIDRDRSCFAVADGRQGLARLSPDGAVTGRFAIGDGLVLAAIAVGNG